MTTQHIERHSFQADEVKRLRLPAGAQILSAHTTIEQVTITCLVPDDGAGLPPREWREFQVIAVREHIGLDWTYLCPVDNSRGSWFVFEKREAEQ